MHGRNEERLLYALLSSQAGGIRHGVPQDRYLHSGNGTGHELGRGGVAIDSQAQGADVEHSE